MGSWFAKFEMEEIGRVVSNLASMDAGPCPFSLLGVRSCASEEVVAKMTDLRGDAGAQARRVIVGFCNHKLVTEECVTRLAEDQGPATGSTICQVARVLTGFRCALIHIMSIHTMWELIRVCWGDPLPHPPLHRRARAEDTAAMYQQGRKRSREFFGDTP
jgi:hypothetical protein